MIGIFERGGARLAVPLLILFFSLVVSPLFAFPDKERTALTLKGVSAQASAMVFDGDQYLFLSFTNNIFRVDTATWDLTTDQVPALNDNSKSGGDNLTGNVTGMAIKGRTLYATQDDGDLLTIDLDHITTAPKTKHIIDGALIGIAADPEGGQDDDKLYLLDKAHNAVVVYKIGDGSKISISLTDSAGGAVTPVAIKFVPFPTDSSTSTVDRIFITTSKGILLVIDEGGASVANRLNFSSTDKTLPALAATPGNNFLLVVNSKDTAVHVFDTLTEAEIDTDLTQSGTNPISLPKNSTLAGILVTKVSNPTDTYAYVTGAQGVSVIDLNLSTTVFSPPTLLDFNNKGSGDTDKDPMTLTSIPGPLIASSDGYILTSNGNASLSVISEIPFVTISKTSLGSTALTTTGSFTVTFQSDKTGSYRVLVGGGITATGTELTTGTVATASTDVTTSSISYDASRFKEGTNRLFVFVTDSAGNRGRDAIDITVDTPPPATVIRSTGFGDQKVYVNFDRLDVSDMDHYNIYVDMNATTVTTKTDSATTVSQPSSGDTVQGQVSGLTNGTTYFVAVGGVDKTGNIGPRVSKLSDGSAATAAPERTIGLAEETGEKGCSLLISGRSHGSAGGIGCLVVGLVILVGAALCGRPVRRSTTRGCPIIIFIFLILTGGTLEAKEKNPQWWSLELKGGAWMPLNATTKNALGSCCDPMGGMEVGFLYKSMLGIEAGAGYVGAGGTAVGATSGATSQDSFSFTMIPLQNSVAFRADFKEDQLLVPYAKAGLDYMIFRESVQGRVTNGFKWGLHMTGGLQILMDSFDDLSASFGDSGINHVFFTLEGRYAWVNSFGRRGVDLSNLTFSGGFLFEF